MKYKNMSAFLLLAITFTVTSFSQDLLSKEEAISQMLVNNFGIKIAENQVEVADNNQSVLNSGYLPTLTGNANAQYDRSNETREFPGAVSYTHLTLPTSDLV